MYHPGRSIFMRELKGTSRINAARNNRVIDPVRRINESIEQEEPTHPLQMPLFGGAKWMATARIGPLINVMASVSR